MQRRSSKVLPTRRPRKTKSLKLVSRPLVRGDADGDGMRRKRKHLISRSDLGKALFPCPAPAPASA